MIQSGNQDAVERPDRILTGDHGIDGSLADKAAHPARHSPPQRVALNGIGEKRRALFAAKDRRTL